MLVRFCGVGENGKLRRDEQDAAFDEQNAQNEENVGNGKQMEELEHPTELRGVHDLLMPK